MTRCDHCNKPIEPVHWRNQSQVIVRTDWIATDDGGTVFCRPDDGPAHTPRGKIR